MPPRTAFCRGLRDVSPLFLGEVPFGMIVGVAAVDAGLTAAEAVAMTVLVFTGAAQLVALDLLGSGSPVPVVVAAALVVNLRYAMYSASIAPHVRHLSRRLRLVVAYLLTDPSYALSMTAFRRGETNAIAYYLGVAAPLWFVFVGATLAGAVLGARVPPAWRLDLAVPLLFLALLAPAVEDRPTAGAALVGGGVAVLARGAPLGLGLLAGAATGIAAGLLAARRWS